MANEKTPVSQKVQDLMAQGLSQHKAVSYAGLNEPAKPPKGNAR